MYCFCLIIILGGKTNEKFFDMVVSNVYGNVLDI